MEKEKYHCTPFDTYISLAEAKECDWIEKGVICAFYNTAKGSQGTQICCNVIAEGEGIPADKISKLERA